jgi:hypothetical protein
MGYSHTSEIAGVMRLKMAVSVLDWLLSDIPSLSNQELEAPLRTFFKKATIIQVHFFLFLVSTYSETTLKHA